MSKEGRDEVRLRRSSVRTVGVLALGVVLAGCATMPDSGTPVPDSGSQDANTQATRLVVVADPPRPGNCRRTCSSGSSTTWSVMRRTTAPPRSTWRILTPGTPAPR
ncbi:hypothetical protein GXW82_27400 [Streptacidiphilus sp. 4-A2]|nr:hypothetical protein [Streptacidiphilus sp. 4-A2]